jgi:hypothetical protein
MTPDLFSLLRVLSSAHVVPTLIKLKRAAGRGKDREALAELEALLEERDG